MQITLLKSKIHRATVTEADLHYVGSLTLDPDLMEAAGMVCFEKVQVVNLNNGSRLETYLIEGQRGSGVVCLNGPAARLGHRGDLVIVITYAEMTPDEARAHRPVTVHVDAANHITSVENCMESN
jgi:aspartate 1-decarboxylase